MWPVTDGVSSRRKEECSLMTQHALDLGPQCLVFKRRASSCLATQNCAEIPLSRSSMPKIARASPCGNDIIPASYVYYARCSGRYGLDISVALMGWPARHCTNFPQQVHEREQLSAKAADRGQVRQHPKEQGNPPSLADYFGDSCKG